MPTGERGANTSQRPPCTKLPLERLLPSEVRALKGVLALKKEGICGPLSFEGATRVIRYEKTSILHLRRTRAMVGPALRPISLSLNLRKLPPCLKTSSDKRLRRFSAWNPRASHT